MRWPFGPPHLTLKPSKKRKKTKPPKNHKKTQKRKTNKEHVKTQKYQKKGFSVISQNFLFWGGVQKFPFLTTWPRKRAPKEHYKNWGFSKAFWKNSYASRNGHFWTKKPYPEIPDHFFGSFLLFQQQKTQNSAETPVL